MCISTVEVSSTFGTVRMCIFLPQQTHNRPLSYHHTNSPLFPTMDISALKDAIQPDIRWCPDTFSLPLYRSPDDADPTIIDLTKWMGSCTRLKFMPKGQVSFMCDHMGHP